MWLQGRFKDEDRPDRLGAILDLLNDGMAVRLSIQEAKVGALDGSTRLQEIAAEYRESMTVRVVEAGNEDDPDRPFRVLQGGGLEYRVRGEVISHYRDGDLLYEKRLPFVERILRRAAVQLRKARLALARRNANKIDR